MHAAAASSRLLASLAWSSGNPKAIDSKMLAGPECQPTRPLPTSLDLRERVVAAVSGRHEPGAKRPCIIR